MVETKKLIGNYVLCPENVLGKGSFGVVYLGSSKSDPKTNLAIKQININVSETELQELGIVIGNEITVVQSLSNSHIVKLIDTVMTRNNLYIITEFCNGGDLGARKNDISIEETLSCIRQISKGMVYANSQKIIHRDLKPSNILIHDGVIKIADFGMSRFVDSHKTQSKLIFKRGSPIYMAPEVFKGKDYCSKCDVWSVGIIFYELLFKKTPWDGSNANDLFYNIKKQILKFPKNENVDPLIMDLIEKMLQIDQNLRYDFGEVLKHEALNKKTMEKIAKAKDLK